MIPGFLCEHPRSEREVYELPPNRQMDNLYTTHRELVTEIVSCKKCGTVLHERVARISPKPLFVPPL